MRCGDFKGLRERYDAQERRLSQSDLDAVVSKPVPWTVATLVELWLCSRGIVPAERGTDDWWIGYRLWLYKHSPVLREGHYAFFPADRLKRIK